MVNGDRLTYNKMDIQSILIDQFIRELSKYQRIHGKIKRKERESLDLKKLIINI
jgi:hypothetical protein